MPDYRVTKYKHATGAVVITADEHVHAGDYLTLVSIDFSDEKEADRVQSELIDLLTATTGRIPKSVTK